MSFIARRALPHDARDLADLAGRTFPLACPPHLGRDAVEGFIRENLGEGSFRAHLADPAHTVLLGRTEDGRAVAYALLVDGASMDPSCAGMLRGRRPTGISKFYLDPSLHGTGGADVLLEAVIGVAAQRDADSLWLATNEGNARARAFYSKNGFHERGHRTFEVGGTLNDDAVYERML